MKTPSFVYILTNKTNTTFYVGVTTDIYKRIYEHRAKVVEGFAEKYHLTKLVHIEEYPTVLEAIAREKQLKNWHREWKIKLIRSVNPTFQELDSEINSE